MTPRQDSTCGRGAISKSFKVLHALEILQIFHLLVVRKVREIDAGQQTTGRLTDGGKTRFVLGALRLDRLVRCFESGAAGRFFMTQNKWNSEVRRCPV